MDTYNGKYLKGTPSVDDFLLHVRGFFKLYITFKIYDVLKLCCLYF